MGRGAPLVLLGLALSLAAAAPAAAQPASPTEDQPPQTIDIWDLLARLRHRQPPASTQPADENPRKPSFVFAPAIGYGPVTGFAVGASGNVAVTFGDPAATRPSSMSFGAQVTLNKLAFTGADFNLFTDGDRWYVEGINTYQLTAQDVYRAGPATSTANTITAHFHFLRVFETVYRRVSRGMFVGAGLNVGGHEGVEPWKGGDPAWATSPYVAYTLEHGFDLTGQRSNGVTIGVLFDTRDKPINPDGGWFGRASYRSFFKGFLGGASSWQQLLLDGRAYITVARDPSRKLALRAYANLVTAGVAPFFDLPATGMDSTWRSGRGYTQGRFRGEKLLYGEIEYRATLTRNGLIGMVAFLNMTTVANSQSKEHLFDQLSPGVGAGLRLLVNKRSRTNLCLDVGFGREGSHGVYLAIQEVF